MDPVQYTDCVKARDYEPLALLPKEVEDALGAIPGVGGVLVAGGKVIGALGSLHRICDYLLNGKLVCLNRDRSVAWSTADVVCALGLVGQIEEVGFEKPFPENIDNDYCINLLLAPYELADFADGRTYDEHYGRIVTNAHGVPEPSYQGYLITEQPGMPAGWGGYSVHFPSKAHITFNPAPVPDGTGGYRVPVLHCECEGSRTHDVCTTLNDITAFGSSKLCKKKILGLPIGKMICNVIMVLLWPLVLAALAIAWAKAAEGTPPPGSGTIQRGSSLVVRGRWVYDAGHSGYNEIHAVHSIQQIPSADCEWENYVGENRGQRWCAETQRVPPAPSTQPPPGRLFGQNPPQPGTHSASAEEESRLTPAQEAVLRNQLQRQHRWLLHPAVDGCLPAD